LALGNEPLAGAQGSDNTAKIGTNRWARLACSPARAEMSFAQGLLVSPGLDLDLFDFAVSTG